MRSILATVLCLSALALVRSGLGVTPEAAAPSVGAPEATHPVSPATTPSTAGPYRTSGAPAGSMALLGLGLAGLTAAGARKPRELVEAID